MEDGKKTARVQEIIRQAGGTTAREISLRNKGLKGDDIPWLLQLLRPLDSLKTLDLSGNSLWDGDASGRTPREVQFQWCEPDRGSAHDPKVIPVFWPPGHGLIKMPYFDRSGVGHAGISEPWLRELGVLRELKSLETLNLGHNGLKDDVALGEGLCELKSLRVLHLNHNSFGDGKTVGLALRRLTSLETVDLSYNGVRDAKALCEGLSELHSLRTLDVSGNLLSDVDDLGAGLRELPSLETLNLCYNELCDAKALGDGLCGLKSLKALNLRGNELSDGKAIGAALRQLRSLRTLDLGLSGLTNGNALGEVLRELKSLRTLDLSYARLGEVKALGDVLRQLRSLETLNLSRCGLRDVKGLCEGLCELTSLGALDLSDSGLSDPGSLAELLRRLLPVEVTRRKSGGCLRTLCISGNRDLGLDDHQLQQTEAADIYRDLRRVVERGQRVLPASPSALDDALELVGSLLTGRKKAYCWLKRFLDANPSATLREIEAAAEQAKFRLRRSSINGILQSETWIGHPPRRKGTGHRRTSTDPRQIDQRNADIGH